MADTDGTSSSPPPVGEPEAGSGSAAERSEIATEQEAAGAVEASVVEEPSDDDPVTAKTQPRKRASALAKTLQTGAGLQETWRTRGIESAAPATKPSEDSGVQPLAVSEPPRSDPSAAARVSSERGPNVHDAAALADTQQDPTRQRVLQRAARSGKLSRTLRMEIKLGSGSPEVRPMSSTDTDPGSAASPSLFRRAAQSGEPQGLVFGSTQRVGTDANSFSSGRSVHATDPLPMGGANTRESFGGVSGGTFSGNGFAPKRDLNSAPPPLPQRKRELRPGERTMVLSRRNVFVKDWLFVVLLVTALGVTASMLVSYRSQPTVEETDDTAQHALTESEEAAQDQALNAPRPAGVRATELRSEPPGAEVIVSGAVVGNTPVRVARESSDLEYTLRLNGYEPQLVRVGANSPATIKVTMQPKTAP